MRASGLAMASAVGSVPAFAAMMKIDPKELFPAAVGLALGVCLMGAFVALALALDLQLYVDYSALPRQ